MKIAKKLLAGTFLSLLICMILQIPVFAADQTTASDQSTETTSDDTAVKSGLRKVNGKYYYYNEKGHKVAGKKMKKYYRTYYYKNNGVTYYITPKKVVEAYRIDSTYYKPNGKEMTSVQAYNYKTELRARKIVAKITNDKMSLAEKKMACFKWVMAKYYVMHRRFKNTPGWPAVFANDHFLKGSGDCHSDAAAFGYLCKALGYTKIYICNDSKGFGHSWCELNGKVYDPLFYQAKGASKTYYGGTYSYKGGSYGEYPVLHVKI